MVNQKDVDEINKKIKDLMKFSNQDLREKPPWVEQMPVKLEQVIDGVDANSVEAGLKKSKSSSEFTEDKWETSIDAIFDKLKIELISIVKTAISEAFEKYGIGGGLQEKESKTMDDKYEASIDDSSSVEESNKNSSIPIGSSNSVEGGGNYVTKFKTRFSDGVESHQFGLVSSFADEGKADTVCLHLPRYNFSRILYDRGKDFCRSNFTEKYFEDFVYELNFAHTYCLHLLIVILDEFLCVNDCPIYTRVLFDRGKSKVISSITYEKFIIRLLLMPGYGLDSRVSHSINFLRANDVEIEVGSKLFVKLSLSNNITSYRCGRVLFGQGKRYELNLRIEYSNLFLVAHDGEYGDGSVHYTELSQLRSALWVIFIIQITRENELEVIPWLHVRSLVMIFYYELSNQMCMEALDKESWKTSDLESYRRKLYGSVVAGSVEFQMCSTGSVDVRSIGWTNGKFISVVCFDVSWCEPDLSFEMLWYNGNVSWIALGLITVECPDSEWQHGTSLLCASEIYRQMAAILECKMSWSLYITVIPYELQWVVPWRVRIASNPYTYAKKICTESWRFKLLYIKLWSMGNEILTRLVGSKSEQHLCCYGSWVQYNVGPVEVIVWLYILALQELWNQELVSSKIMKMLTLVLMGIHGQLEEETPLLADEIEVFMLGERVCIHKFEVMGIQFLLMGSQIINVYLVLVKNYRRLKFRLPLIGICSVVHVHLVGMGFTWVYSTIHTLTRRICMREGIRLIPLKEFQYMLMLPVSVHVIGGIHSSSSRIRAILQVKWRGLQSLSSALYLLVGYNQVVGVCYFHLTRYLFHCHTHFSWNYSSSTSPVCLFTSWYKGNGGGTVCPFMVLSSCVRLLFYRGRSHKFIYWNSHSGRFSIAGLITVLYTEESVYMLVRMVVQGGTWGIADMRVKLNCLSTDVWKVIIHLTTVTVRFSITLQWMVHFMLKFNLFHLWNVISGCTTTIIFIAADYKLLKILLATKDRRLALQGIEDKDVMFFVVVSMKTTILRCREVVQQCQLMRYGHLGCNNVVSLIQKMIVEASREALPCETVQFACEYKFKNHVKELRQGQNSHVLEVFLLYLMGPVHEIRAHVLEAKTEPPRIRWTKGLTYAGKGEPWRLHFFETTRTIMEVQLPTMASHLHKLQSDFVTIFEDALFISISSILEDKDDLKEGVFVMSQLWADPSVKGCLSGYGKLVLIRCFNCVLPFIHCKRASHTLVYFPFTTYFQSSLVTGLSEK